MADGHSEDSYCVLLGFAGPDNLWLIDTRSKAIRIFNTRTKNFRTIMATDAVDGILHFDPSTGKVDIWTYLSMSTKHFSFAKDSLVKEEHFFDGAAVSRQPRLLIFHVYFQNDSTVWLSSAKGLIELNPITRAYTIYNSLKGEAVTELRCVSQSPNGLLSIGTGGFGVFTFDPRSGKFIDHFGNYALDQYSICSNNIVSIYFDSVGNIWCGSYGNGISYAHVENNFFSKSLSKEEMDFWKKGNDVSWMGRDQENNIWCILEDVQGFWLLDSSLQVKALRWPVLENGKRFAASVYQLFFDGKSGVWCMTDRGLFLYNIETNRIKQVEYPRLSDALFGSYWTKMMIRLHDSSLLFSTFGGIYRIANEHGQYHVLPFSPLNEIPFSSFDLILEDSEHNIFVKDIGEDFYVLSPTEGNGRYTLRKSLHFKGEIIQMQEAGPDLYLGTNEKDFSC